MCKKVGNEKEEVILDTKADKKEEPVAETVNEVISDIPEVVLSEESKRQNIKFSDQIEFKYCCLSYYSVILNILLNNYKTL